MRKHGFLTTLCGVIAILVLGCTSCSDDNGGDGTVAEASISPAALEFAADGAEVQTIQVKSNVEFLVATDASWCNVSLASGANSLDRTYSVKCEANTLARPRTASVKVRTTDGAEIASAAVRQLAVGGSSEPEPEVVPLAVNTVYEALGLGWNLGNQLDAHSNGVSAETCWGNPVVDRTLFDAIKNAGFKSVRIPVTWLGHIGAAPDYKLDDSWLNRVAEIVGYAESAGLYAIINIHHDGADSQYWLDINKASTNAAANTAIEAEIAAIWAQVARKFADKGEFLIFESMNEIHDGKWGWGANRTDGGKQYRTFNHWQQVFVDAVRAAGGENTNRWLGIPAYCTNIDLSENLILPDDASKRLMVAVHCYEPYEYTLNATYSEWGHTGKADKKDKSDEKTLVNEFDKAVKRWSEKGIPVYIGEFGCVHRAEPRAESFRRYYLEYYTKAASDRLIPAFYWDNGYDGAGTEMSGLFNRATGAYVNNSEDIVSAMMNGYYSPSLTLEDVYNSAPK